MKPEGMFNENKRLYIKPQLCEFMLKDKSSDVGLSSSWGSILTKLKKFL